MKRLKRRGFLLIEAVRKLNVDKVKSLLTDPDINLNVKNNFGEPALVFAARHGHTEIVEMLLSHHDIDVNIIDDDNWTPLMYASLKNRIGVVKLLLACPDLINTKNKYMYTALMFASDKQNCKIVKLLSSHFWLDINDKSFSGETALSKAARWAHDKVVKILLAHGAKPNEIDDKWKSATKSIIINWKTCLPSFKRFADSNKYYPLEFKQWAFNFVLCCQREKTFCKDLIYLLLEYVAEAWKLN